MLKPDLCNSCKISCVWAFCRAIAFTVPKKYYMKIFYLKLSCNFYFRTFGFFGSESGLGQKKREALSCSFEGRRTSLRKQEKECCLGGRARERKRTVWFIIVGTVTRHRRDGTRWHLAGQDVACINHYTNAQGQERWDMQWSQPLHRSIHIHMVSF